MAISLRAASGSAVAARSLASRRTVSCVRSSRTTAVVVRASVSPVKPPAGVTLPPKQPEVPPPMFGFVDWAEKMNSRAAMIGFFALLAVEGITGKGFLEVIGWKIGSGLGFEL